MEALQSGLLIVAYGIFVATEGIPAFGKSQTLKLQHDCFIIGSMKALLQSLLISDSVLTCPKEEIFSSTKVQLLGVFWEVRIPGSVR